MIENRIEASIDFRSDHIVLHLFEGRETLNDIFVRISRDLVAVGKEKIERQSNQSGFLGEA